MNYRRPPTNDVAVQPIPYPQVLERVLDKAQQAYEVARSVGHYVADTTEAMFSILFDQPSLDDYVREQRNTKSVKGHGARRKRGWVDKGQKHPNKSKGQRKKGKK
tara:strand:+ start:1404 stop:1718 length:315 start_codon:yes stop_codon:yes gene_type:complete